MTAAFNLSQFANKLNTSGQLDPASTSFSGVLPIASGGSNNASLAVTAGGVIYTDGTKFMNVGAGSAGQVLTSQGAGAPTWSSSNIGLAGIQIYTTATTSNWTVPTGVTKAWVMVVGGGGGGAGGSAGVYGGGGGGSGGTASAYVTGLTPTGTVSYTVGAGGNGTTNTNGGTGGTSSFGAFASATGGQGGRYGSGANGAGGTGGAGTAGDYLGRGNSGSNGSDSGGNGAGCSHFFGIQGDLGGGVGGNDATAGTAATRPSAGGGGASFFSGVRSGGNGAAGMIVIVY